MQISHNSGATGSLLAKEIFRHQLRQSGPVEALLRAHEQQLSKKFGMLKPPKLTVDYRNGEVVATFGTATRQDNGIGGDVPHSPGAGAELSAGEIQIKAPRLPFADESFETVVCHRVLQRVADIDGALGEFNRILRTDGRLILSVPSERFADTLGGSRICRRLRLVGLAESYGEWVIARLGYIHTDPPEYWSRRMSRHDLDVSWWSYYVPDEAHRSVDLARYLAWPLRVFRGLTSGGAHRTLTSIDRLFYRWLSRHAGSSFDGEAAGAFLMFEARKSGGHG